MAAAISQSALALWIAMIFGESNQGREGKNMSLPQLVLARIGLAAVAAVLAAGPAAAQAPTAAAPRPIKVVLQGSVRGPAAPFFVALDRGYYHADKLDVAIEPVTTGPDAISRVVLGTADFTVADINAFMKFRDQNPNAPLKAVFMIYNKPAYAIIARKSRGITKPEDLMGKTLGAPEADLVTALWPLFAKLNGIDVARVKVENIAVAVREPILAAGQVDAVTGSSLSTYINMKERGVPVDDLVVLPMSNYGLQLYGDAIIVNSKFAAQNPEAVKSFLHAYVRGLQATIHDPVRAVAAVLKRNENAKKDIELERLRMAIADNIVTDEAAEDGLGGVDAARFAVAITQVTEAFKLKLKPTPADVFDRSFLPPAAQRKVNGRQRAG
jgi:NitT/TauT family transport system substrate-binding protein